MAPRLPVQQLVVSPDKNFLVLAINSHLQLFDRAAGTRLCSTEDAGLNPPGSNHSGLIRLLLIHQELDAPEKAPLLISTGEDKLLKTWQLPDLKLLHSRQLIKRATSIAVSPNGKNIVIADKFGDVYDLPFDAPSQTVFQSDPDQEEAPKSTADQSSGAKDADSKVEGEGTKAVARAVAPIAGHVSVLTSLVFIPRQPSPLLVTADRDEHIRMSRYPQAWSIEGYLLGHRKFVGALLWLPHPTDPEPAQGRLLSAGGDNALFVWDHLRGLATQTIDLSGIANGLKVCPAKQAWFSKSRTNKRRRTNPIEKAEPAPTGSEPPSAPAIDQNNSAGHDQHPAAQDVHTESALELQPIVQKTCVNKIVYTTPSDHAGPGYVLVTSVGSSTIAYIPLPRIFDTNQATEAGQITRYLDLGLPVLDLAVLSPGLVLVSLDSSFPSDSSSPSSSFRTLSLTPDKIKEVSDPEGFNLAFLNESGSIESSSELPMPSQELLYPELLLFTKDSPGTSALDNKPHGRDVGTGGRSGKKGEGRLVSQARCEIVLAKAAIS
ncbi:tRNA (guanine-N(7)-)-methyltransferase non-catalytic subunit trm82 [Puccinia graminis f. sp. tritici]|uniref:tRNA (Guanine-N(7)-)-methyltransferase non-catalytic subunit trm82 n=1 Tax=Puccinia graminis f. sp. tritici TaxID=56615 RepID=A0A5B0PTS4_PUCGR|nr:tRNA (guanine-N(7)-)-methyltransferase non-catalytic subunit trm82 [Puccinia graminis f. sp. tritici]